MGTNRTQRRIICDTFEGGTFHLEMTENRSATSPYPMDTGNLNLKRHRTPKEQDLFENPLNFTEYEGKS